MSHLYEGKIKNMGNAGRNGGEYYTPRPLIKTIVKVVSPEIGNKIYDGAVGSAGFLCEAFNYLKKSKKLGTKDMSVLQKSTFYGKEKKSLAYIIGTMNMILHGIEAPNIVHTNTLSENISDIQEKDRYDIILANPPFGGKERKEVQQNFPIKTGETAFLFFEKGAPTRKIWFYQLNLDRNLGKTNPLNEDDLAEFVKLQKKKENSGNSWSVDIKDVDISTFDLSIKNPNNKNETILREPKEILAEISKLDKESAVLMDNLQLIIENGKANE